MKAENTLNKNVLNGLYPISTEVNGENVKGSITFLSKQSYKVVLDKDNTYERECHIPFICGAGRPSEKWFANGNEPTEYGLESAKGSLKKLWREFNKKQA